MTRAQKSGSRLKYLALPINMYTQFWAENPKQRERTVVVDATEDRTIHYTRSLRNTTNCIALALRQPCCRILSYNKVEWNITVV